MAVNNIYYVDMEKRYRDFQEETVDMRNLHPMVYDDRNVALAVRQLSQSPGRMALGPDGTNYKTLEKYSVEELSEIVRERLFSKRMDYVRRTYIPKSNGKMRPLGIQTENVTVDFAEGDTVIVMGGIWKDTVGVIQTMNHNKQSVTINVDLFGRETPVEINFSEIRRM